jgi:hypothetical protein
MHICNTTEIMGMIYLRACTEITRDKKGLCFCPAYIMSAHQNNSY